MVATWMLKSLMTGWLVWPETGASGETSSVDIVEDSLLAGV
jgi:hypothetical protein